MSTLPTEQRIKLAILRLVLQSDRGGDDPIGLAERAWAFVAGEDQLTIASTAVERPSLAAPAPEPLHAVQEAPRRRRAAPDDGGNDGPDRLWRHLAAAQRRGERMSRSKINAEFEAAASDISSWLRLLAARGRIRAGGHARGSWWEVVESPDDEAIPPAPAAQRTAPTMMRRHTTHYEPRPEEVTGLAADHPAIVGSRTLFPSTVVDPADSPRLLVSGHNSRKIGAKVTKGEWVGFPIYTLTLEERASCPRDCFHWATCYGNGMPLARRHRHGSDLERLLARELNGLQQAHPDGYVVRAHVLGDFYSVEYVAAWQDWLTRFPALHVFGYTAWSPDSEIGGAVARVRDEARDRFAIRFSSEAAAPGGATTLWKTPEGPREGDVVVCPAQTGGTDCCGTCGLCWAPSARDLTIGFIAHGQTSRSAPPRITPPQQKPLFEWLREPVDWLAGRVGEKVQPIDGKPGLFAIAGQPGEFTARDLLRRINDLRDRANLPLFSAPRIDPPSGGNGSALTMAGMQ